MLTLRCKEAAHIFNVIRHWPMTRVYTQKLEGALENLLITHVFPEFQSPHGFMRFRYVPCSTGLHRQLTNKTGGQFMGTKL